MREGKFKIAVEIIINRRLMHQIFSEFFLGVHCTLDNGMKQIYFTDVACRCMLMRQGVMV